MSTSLVQKAPPVPRQRYYRKVIKIRAEDSPNIRYARAQIRAGIEPTDEIIVPGVKPWSEYLKNRKLWDKVRQCVALDAEFYEGAENLLYPPDWLNLAETRAEQLRGVKRCAKYLGCDTAQGDNNTAWCAIDDLGIVELVMEKTPDTAVIPGKTLALMRKYSLSASNIMFDAGGGGREHADQLRSMGYQVRTVGFGEAVAPEIKHGEYTVPQRRVKAEDKYVYKNRRAEMYGLLRELLRPIQRVDGSLVSEFAMPAEIITEPRSDGGPSLRQQLAIIPLWYDKEGRMYLPPKRRNPDAPKGQDKKPTMIEICGVSPDEADALVLAVYCRERRVFKSHAGAV